MSKNISDPQIDGYFPEPWEKSANVKIGDLEYRVRGLEDTMNDDEEEASVLTRLRAHKDDIGWLKRRLKHLEEQLDILKLRRK